MWTAQITDKGLFNYNIRGREIVTGKEDVCVCTNFKLHSIGKY